MKMHITLSLSVHWITLFNCISNMGMQKPISLDLILYGDSDISYVENITLFNIVHEYIVKTKRLKIISTCILYAINLSIEMLYNFVSLFASKRFLLLLIYFFFLLFS